VAFTNIYNYLKRLKEGHLHGKLKNSTIIEKNKKRGKKIEEKNKEDYSYILL
jgi:hypothetical protein